jgi:hypothetical protein
VAGSCFDFSHSFLDIKHRAAATRHEMYSVRVILARRLGECHRLPVFRIPDLRQGYTDGIADAIDQQRPDANADFSRPSSPRRLR